MDQHKAQVILYRQDGCDFSARTPFSLFTSQQTKVKEVEYKLTISAIFPMLKSEIRSYSHYLRSDPLYPFYRAVRRRGFGLVGQIS